MKKYKVQIFDGSKSVELNVANRKRIFEEGEEVQESIYTESYPHYFEYLGNTEGYNINLAQPSFFPKSQISDFLSKETERKKEHSENKTYKEMEEIEDLIKTEENIENFDVKIETEE
jgi:hypothetical protein